MTDLETYLEQQLAAAWRWGGDGPDCILAAANWVWQRTGVDPAAEIRWKYHDLRSAHRLIKRNGGMAELISRQMSKHGFPLTTYPEAGDVGLVDAPTHLSANGRVFSTLVGAICLGPLWCIKTEAGHHIFEMRPVLAWQIC
ncbi:hypothetical protein [Pleomorphomonas sp. PLEO]|uniref:DUF6950 family protein n=1 Tax=Pleomorphomonas sp. PLEO TaxID=3239306 RepID=UPI00351E96A2